MTNTTTLPICVIPTCVYGENAPVKPTVTYTYTGKRTDTGLVQHLVCTAVGLGMIPVGISNLEDGIFDLELAGTDATFAAFDAIVLA